MYKLEKYLNDRFGINARILLLRNDETGKLPVYMRNYNLKQCTIHNVKMITVMLRDYKEFTIERLRKQAEIIEKILGYPAVFVMENLESYNRKRLIQKKVAFIIPGKQIYIPFLLLEFREIKNQKDNEKEKFSPAVQYLLLYHLLGNKIEGLNFKTIAKKIGYGPMTITRAAQTLSKYKLCRIEEGKNKTLIFENNKRKVWSEALPFLSSPFEREIYLDENTGNNEIFIAGINALAHYTNIADERKKTFAVYKNKLRIQDKNSNEGEYAIQVWNYDPKNLTKNRYVDPLSLYLSLMNTKDERVEKELDTLIGELW